MSAPAKKPRLRPAPSPQHYIKLEVFNHISSRWRTTWVYVFVMAVKLK